MATHLQQMKNWKQDILWPFLVTHVIVALGYFCKMVDHLQHVLHMRAKSLQLSLTLCDPMDCSLPGSSVHGILQARILEWVAISSFRELS